MGLLQCPVDNKWHKKNGHGQGQGFQGSQMVKQISVFIMWECVYVLVCQ